MAFSDDEVKFFETTAEEMAKKIEDQENTSNEAAVAFGKIGRICARALSQHAAIEAKRSTRTSHVTKFQSARLARAEKARSAKQHGGSSGSPSQTTSQPPQSGSSRRTQTS